MKDTCATCSTKAGVLKCLGCQVIFCHNDYNLHRRELDQQLDKIVNELNAFQDTSNESNVGFKSFLIDQIDTWERNSITKLKQTAEEARQRVEELIMSRNKENATCIREVSQKIGQGRQDDGFNEQDLTKWKKTLDELKKMISKPRIKVNEKQSENPFIMKIYVDEYNRFAKTCGMVLIEQDGHLARHAPALFSSHGEIRGEQQYSTGLHRIQLKIDQLDLLPWWFFGIISKSTAMQSHSYKSSTAYGWAGNNEVYMNGECLKNINGYTSDYAKGDVIEIILDCDHHLIHMFNIRSKKSHEINVDLSHCPFPWVLHLNLLHMHTRIRIDS